MGDACGHLEGRAHNVAQSAIRSVRAGATRVATQATPSSRCDPSRAPCHPSHCIVTLRRSKLGKVFESPELSRQLQDSKRFHRADQRWLKLLKRAREIGFVVQCCYGDDRTSSELKELEAEYEQIERGISEYLEIKKKAFPRFYFISAHDLLQTVSDGREPAKHRYGAFTDSTQRVTFERGANDGPEAPRTVAVAAADTKDGRELKFVEPFVCCGAVEDYLSGLVSHMMEQSRLLLRRCITAWAADPLGCLVGDTAHLSQHCLVAISLSCVSDLDSALLRRAQGEATAVDAVAEKFEQFLELLLTLMVNGMTRDDRITVKTIHTTHARSCEFTRRLAADKSLTVGAFARQAQIRYEWDAELDDAFVTLSNYRVRYQHEFLGNPGRLVVTDLTDRYYLVATQAFSFALGCAAYGPAGTGKTETGKDLGRFVAVWTIVSNCSEQMSMNVMRDCFAGLVQTGAWGIFDEFNRILASVIASVADIVAGVCSALRARADIALIDGDPVALRPTMAWVITYNPGYLGRTELPEALHKYMRPVAMLRPDMAAIATMNLLGERFQGALRHSGRNLGGKMVGVFKACQVR